MDFTYSFPQVKKGYRWNALKRCLWEIGIEPVSMSDSNEQTYLVFPRQLLAEEHEKLKKLMSDDPEHPPKGDRTIITIKDIWEYFEELKQETRLPNLCLYFTESKPGSGWIDQIELHHKDQLTDQQIELIRKKYYSLFQ